MMNRITLWRSKHKILILVLLVISIFSQSGECQTPADSVQLDSSRQFHERRGAGGFEAGNSWRSDGFHGIFFHLFYEAEIGKAFLNAGAFSYQKINDGFGFDFRLRMPYLFYPSGSHTNFSPLVGVSFTVWPVYKPTVSVGIPFGLEYEFLIDNFPNISVSANASPLINLSSEKNTVIFDLRLGIRFD